MVCAPAANTVALSAKLKNRLAARPVLLAKAKSKASVNPTKRVASDTVSYKLIWKLAKLKAW